MRLLSLACAFALCVTCGPAAFAQVDTAPKADGPLDPTPLFDTIRAAYYHPGKIAISCDATLDFTSVAAKLGTGSSGEVIKALAGLKLHISSIAGGTSKITFDWPATFPADLRPQMETGARQMLDGFFANYWPLVNAEMLPVPADKPSVAGTVGGGYMITAKGTALRLTVDKDGLVRRLESHSNGHDTMLVLSYTPSPNPQPGDRMRLSGMDVDQRGGMAARLTPAMKWDDQDVAGVHIPNLVRIGVPGMFDVPITLSACTVTPAAAAK